MERVTITLHYVEISLCSFIYSSFKGACYSSLSDLGYQNWKSSMNEHNNIIKSEKLVTQI